MSGMVEYVGINRENKEKRVQKEEVLQ